MKMTALFLFTIVFTLTGYCMYLHYDQKFYYPLWFKTIVVIAFSISFAALVSINW